MPARNAGRVKAADVSVIPPEPAEAQPPAGVVLEEPAVEDALDADVVAVEANADEMAALLGALDLEPVADLTVEAPREAWVPVVGAVVTYVASRADMDSFGPGHAPGDVLPALVVAVRDDGHLDLRVFIRGEGVPYRAGVPLMLDPREVTLDHQGRCFRPER